MADKTTEESDKPTSGTGSTSESDKGGGKAGESTTTTEVHTERPKKRSAMKADVKAIRTGIARLLWTVCLVFAFVLAASVLLIAIEANRQNDLVDFLFKFADKVDLGFFDLADPIKDFDKDTGPGQRYQDTKTALFNYGIAAVVWLVIGRIADRIVRP